MLAVEGGINAEQKRGREAWFTPLLMNMHAGTASYSLRTGGTIKTIPVHTAEIDHNITYESGLLGHPCKCYYVAACWGSAMLARLSYYFCTVPAKVRVCTYITPHI